MRGQSLNLYGGVILLPTSLFNNDWRRVLWEGWGAETSQDTPGLRALPAPHHVHFCALFRQEAMKLPRSTPEERDRWAPLRSGAHQVPGEDLSSTEATPGRVLAINGCFSCCSTLVLPALSWQGGVWASLAGPWATWPLTLGPP